MSNFEIPVELYMTEQVHSIPPDANLDDAWQVMAAMGVSSLPVVDGDQALLGVVSRTDLIRVGRRQAGSRPKATLLTLPDQRIREVATREVATIGPAEPLSKAAERMVGGRFHRIFVIDDGQLIGVLSTRDVMLAIRDKRVARPISDVMSSPIFSVRADEPVSLATERLEKAHVTGLVVLDDDWPVGLFTQLEALDSRDRERDTHVDEVMSAAVLVLDERTPLHRAAAQAAEMDARRVVATKGQRVVGILTGLDFARVAA